MRCPCAEGGDVGWFAQDSVLRTPKSLTLDKKSTKTFKNQKKEFRLKLYIKNKEEKHKKKIFKMMPKSY